MTRVWNELIARLADLVTGGMPTMVFLSLVAALLVALGWYFWPGWLPWNWNLWSRERNRGDRDGSRFRGRFRFGSLRWRWRLRWRRRRRGKPSADVELPADELPDLPAAVFADTADQLAAQGRFAEAVRERLRAIVRDLIERGVIPFSPGWTVTELAAAASRARPELAPSLSAAAMVFSDIWYGLRAAQPEDDAAMRAHAATITRLLMQRAPADLVAPGPGGGLG